MIPMVAKKRPAVPPNAPPLSMLTPAYTAIEPMAKSTTPQMNRIGMNRSTSRRVSAQVLLANSESASRTWKPPRANITIAAYVTKLGRPIVGVWTAALVRPSSCVDDRVGRSLGCSGVLSLSCSTIIFLSLTPALAHGCPSLRHLARRGDRLHRSRLPAFRPRVSNSCRTICRTHNKSHHDGSAAAHDTYSPKDKRQSSYPDPDVEQQDEAKDEAQGAKDANPPSFSPEGHNQGDSTQYQALDTEDDDVDRRHKHGAPQRVLQHHDTGEDAESAPD